MAAPMMLRSPLAAQAALRSASEAISRTSKSGAAAVEEARGIDAAHQAMGGQNLQAGRVHVDEGHDHAAGAGEVRVVAAEGHGGFVAVVAVGDEQFLVRHELLDLGGGADLPHAVDGAVLVGDFGDGRRGGGLIEQGVDGAGRVGIEHEDGFEVGVGVLEQLHAVLLGTGEGLLVAEDDARGVVFHLAEGDEALADEALAGIGNDEFLEVGEHAGFGIARPDAAQDPLLHGAGGAGVDIFGFAVAGAALSEDDAHQIVGARLEVVALHGRRDLVVGLGDKVL